MSGDVPNFPVLVRLGSTESAIIADVQNGAPDIRFIYQSGTQPGNGQSAYCPYEIQRWDASSNKAEIWVLVPTVFSGSTSYIRMWYNDGVDGAVIDRQDATAVFATTNNFAGVWHMNQDPSGGAGSMLDATSNANDGTPTGLSSSNVVESIIGKGMYFDGTSASVNEVIDCGSGASLNITNNVTVEAWGYYDSTSIDYWHGFLERSGASNQVDYGIDMTDGGYFRTWINSSSDYTATPISSLTWFYVSFTYDRGPNPDIRTLYINDNAPDIYTADVAFSSNYTFKIGKNWDWAWHGVIDEVRISNSTRSADWVELSFDTQKEDQSVVTISQP